MSSVWESQPKRTRKCPSLSPIYTHTHTHITHHTYTTHIHTNTPHIHMHTQTTHILTYTSTHIPAHTKHTHVYTLYITYTYTYALHTQHTHTHTHIYTYTPYTQHCLHRGILHRHSRKFRNLQVASRQAGFCLEGQSWAGTAAAWCSCPACVRAWVQFH